MSDLIKCCICNNFSEDILYNSICGHSACTKCFEKILKNSKLCPKCKKKIDNKKLRKLPFIDQIKELIEERKNTLSSLPSKEELDEDCEKHKNNKIYYYCFDCQEKMCKICLKEEKKNMKIIVISYLTNI